VSVTDLLNEARNRNIRLWLEGEKLRFQAPAGAMDAGMRESVAAHRDDLVAFLRRISARAEEGGSIPKRPEGIPAPLSFAQQRLWFLDEVGQLGPAYNISGALRMTGRFDEVAFRESVVAVVSRHEVLRTTVRVENGVANVEADIQPESVLTVKDLTHLPKADRESAGQAFLEESAMGPFDLAVGPLTRILLIKLANEEHLLGIAMHHIVSDGWSVAILTRELTDAYQALRDGKPAFAKPLLIQYADYAAWQREHYQGDRLKRAQDHWREALSGAPHVLTIPGDRVRPAEMSYRGALVTRRIPAELVASLRRLGHAENATLYSVCLAAYGILLSRWTGALDVIVGSPVANRDGSDQQKLIGLFVNTLVLRCDLTGAQDCRTVVRRVAQFVTSALDQQGLPFEMVLEALNVVREPARTPLVQVSFALHNQPAGDLTLPGLTLAPIHFESNTAKLDLYLSLDEVEDGLQATMEYATDLFDEPQVSAMLEQYTRILEGIVRSPEMAPHDLDLLSDRDRAELVAASKGPIQEIEYGICAHALFQKVAEQYPSSLALIRAELPGATDVWEFDSHITYAELNRIANRLARHLREVGVSRESVVGLRLKGRLENVIGMLAILKAGGTYLPLSTSDPDARVAEMIRDADARVVIVGPGSRIEFESVTFVPLTQELLVGYEDSNLATISSPQNLAYVLYTSGSTGKPKGACISHHNLSSYIQAITPPEGSHRFLQNAAVTFDISAFEIWCALLKGAALVCGPQTILSPQELGRLINEHELDVVVLTPVMFDQMVDNAPESLRRLRWLQTGGDVASVPHMRKAVPYVDGIILNIYGPTECTVYTITHEVLSVPEDLPSVPIGITSPNTAAYILDDRMRLLPDGIVGDLYIAADGVGRGYLGRPGLTARQFVPDPYSGMPGDRMYLTGDRVRRRADGTIEFIGRVDRQIKLRGFRIELNEVEAALTSFHSVAHGAVVVRETGAGAKALVAYYEALDGHSIDLADIKRHMLAALPPYMTPTVYMPMERLPMTPHGKVDRKGLPAPVQTAAEAVEYVAPGNAVEETLAGIWQDILRLPRVGVTDNFFELGGDSILAMQVIARAASAGIRLTARQTLEAQTVARQAQVAQLTAVTQIEAVSQSGPLGLTPIQCWLFDHALEQPGYWNNAVVLKVASELQPQHIETALRELIRHHGSLRLRFEGTGSGSQPTANIVDDDNLPFEIADLSGVSEAERPAEMLSFFNRAQSSLNLADGPILRAVYAHLGLNENARLLLAIHHLAVDGLSWRILLDDLELLISSALHGKSVTLPPVDVPLNAWIKQITEAAKGEALTEIGYWRNLPVAASLPRDFEGSRNMESSAATVSVTLGAEETEALLTSANAAFRTSTEEILLAALARAVGGWAGSPDVLVDLERHGRDALEAVNPVRVTGWFTSLFPVALPASGTPDIQLTSVKVQLRSVPNKGGSWGILRYLSAPEIQVELGKLPSPEISFNYLGQIDQVLQGSGLLEVCDDNPGDTRAAVNVRTHLLEVNAVVTSGRLRIDWRYGGDVHQRETVEKLANAYIERLQEIIEICGDPASGFCVPCDFPDAGLNDEQLRQALLEVGSHPGVDSRNIEDILPLSHQQRGILMETIAAVRDGIHMEQLAFTVKGEMNADALETAWQAVVNEHPALRTSFAWQSLDQPVQIVFRKLPARWRYMDWRDIDPADLEEKYTEFLAEDRRDTFSPEAAPLMRLTAIQTSGGWHIVWTLHHILMDGWSVPLLFQSVQRRYEAAIAGDSGTGSSRGNGSRIYGDFVRWQRDQDLEDAAAFWRQSLADAHTPTEIGVDDEAADVDGMYGDCVRLLDAKTSSLLREVCRTQRVSLNTLMQAGWGLLLSRYSNRRDVVFGVTLSGRPMELAGIEETVGLFITSLPLRLTVDGSASIGTYLSDVQRAHAGITAYQHCAAGQVHQWSGASGSSALFETLLVFENYPAGGDTLLGGQSATLRYTGARTQYTLALVVTPGDGIHLNLIYDGRYLNGLQAELILDHLAQILLEFAQAESEKIAHLKVAGLVPNVDRETAPRMRPRLSVVSNDLGVPRNAVELRLAQIWESLLAVSPIGIRQNFFELGGHSLLALEMVSRVRDEFDSALPLAAVLREPTIEGIARSLGDIHETSSTLVRLSGSGARTPFFLAPGASGNPFSYIELARRLGADQPVIGLQTPGLDGRGPSPETIEELAALHVASIREVHPEGLYLLGGHSFGAAVVYEMASMLTGMGEEVALVAIIDLEHPEVAPEYPADRSDAEWLADIADALARFTGQTLAITLEDLQAAPEDQQHNLFLQSIIDAGIAPPNTDLSLVRALLQVYRSSTNALRNFHPGRFEGNLAVFRAADGEASPREDLGWSRCGAKRISAHTIPGDHISMIAKPNVDRLAAELRGCIEAAGKD